MFKGPKVKTGPTAGRVRSRNKNGQWRKKRSDAGKSRNRPADISGYNLFGGASKGDSTPHGRGDEGHDYEQTKAGVGVTALGFAARALASDEPRADWRREPVEREASVSCGDNDGVTTAFAWLLGIGVVINFWYVVIPLVIIWYVCIKDHKSEQATAKGS